MIESWLLLRRTTKHLNFLGPEDGGFYHAQADNRPVGVDYPTEWITAGN